MTHTDTPAGTAEAPHDRQEAATRGAGEVTRPSRHWWQRLGWTTRRRRALISAAGGVVLWEIVARFVVEGTLFFVPLTSVVAAGVEMTLSGELGRHAWVSLQEFLYGIGSAIVVGIPLGLAIGVSERVRDYAQPWISGLYSTPLIALAPLFILWLRTRRQPRALPAGGQPGGPRHTGTRDGLLRRAGPAVPGRGPALERRPHGRHDRAAGAALRNMTSVLTVVGGQVNYDARVL